MNRKEKIKKVAKKLFTKYWYKKTTIDQIVEKAWVAKGTFYLYYPNKDKLYSEIILGIMSNWKCSVNKLLDETKDLKERLYLKMLKTLIFMEKNPLILKIAKRNPLYFSETINEEFMHEKHLEMVKSVLWEDENKSFLTVWEIETIFWFYTYIFEIESYFETKEEFFSFAKKFAWVIISWILQKNEIDYKKMDKIINKLI